jgi:hypothetical protein
MLEKYLSMKGFVAYQKIEGVPYAIIKTEFTYDVFKKENRIERCDSKKEALNYLTQVRMDLRDDRIRATRESLERKGINTYADHNGSMKQIMEAYRDYKGF